MDIRRVVGNKNFTFKMHGKSRAIPKMHKSKICASHTWTGLWKILQVQNL